MTRETTQPRRPARLPAGKQRELASARRRELITLVLRVAAAITLYATLGSSQALHAVWLKSLWSLLPPSAFLAAVRIEGRPPTPRFPYGFHRAGSIAFMTSALALSCMGLYMMFSGSHSLIEHRQSSLPTFAVVAGPGHWPGWWIIAALTYSAAVPWIIGWGRKQMAIDLHDKGLYADASMGRMDWLAGITAIVGVLGLGFGIWWLDFVAALIIGINVFRHGLRHLHTAVCDLIDEVPRRIASCEIDPLGATIHDYLRRCDWVDEVRVRLREEGRLLTGIALIRPTERSISLECLDQASRAIKAMDWRLFDFQLVPTDDKLLDDDRRT